MSMVINKTKIVIYAAIIFVLLIPIQAGAQLAAGKSKFLGNIIASSVPANYSKYWNQITPENSSKWGSVQSSQTSWNWSQVDTAYNYAKSNGMKFKFHTFVWGSQEPSWIGSASNQAQAVETWISTACARYPNMDYIDVVNEALHAPASYRNALGGSGTTGWDWVVWSFQTARKYTSAKLLINDYNICYQDSATTQYINIVNILKGKGLIDGVGEQWHSYEAENLTTLNNNLNKLRDTGIPVYISEWEARGDDNTQLNIYKNQFPMIWENTGVQGITLWGYINGTMWRNEGWLVSSADNSATERPAIPWIRSYLGAVATAVPTAAPTATPVVTNPPAKLGDVNNDNTISIVDALLIAQYYVGLNPSPFNTANADTNQDGSITITDALLIAQCYVGLSCTF
jgi:endo-1,4-beta-xylanase